MYQEKSSRYLPQFKFPSLFSVCFTKNHWSNTEKTIEFFEETIFLYLDMTKEEQKFPKEQCCCLLIDFEKSIF